MTISPSLIAAFAPTGKLRASINVGNPILAAIDAKGNAAGVSVDMANALAEKMGVEIELIVFNAAVKSVDAVVAEEADFGFFAIDPIRGARIAFTAPYVLIEGCYLVRDGSPIKNNDAVDREGNRVMVGAGSAYDLFLTRELKHAEIIRVQTSASVVDAYLEQAVEVAAGVKQQLQADVKRRGGIHLLDEQFMIIQQAMGLPKTRGEEAANYLRKFVEEMKRSGFVASALQRHNITGAVVGALAP
ncbi:MAG: bacterial extracellular solute-binding s, 3 family protein [Herbaspirillum sp.]|jgi:polar amino acid transport system substrate-binding protein|nr:bacterial extracellular solute-binding s, 3 family protein [Herbaspirillum sp.]